MEGLILNEESKYVTYMSPIFDALGDDYIRSLNWRIIYPECGSVEQVYSFEHIKDSWISGDELVEQIRKNPNIQWWWGLLQGIPKIITREDVEKEVFDGLKPCVIGIILATGLLVVWNSLNIQVGIAFDYITAILTAVLAILYYVSRKIVKKGISPILLIVISGAVGIMVYGFK